MNIDGVIVTSEKIISTNEGDVLHGIKMGARGYVGFGEAYFSTIHPRAVKAWKRHREMTLNLLVPLGKIRFILHDDRPESPTNGAFQQIILSRKNYNRLTVPPLVWMGFQGVGVGQAMLLNIADIQHDPAEIDRKTEDGFLFDWSSNV